MILYGISTCDTCKKAIKALTAAGPSPEFRDIRANPLTEADINKALAATGNVALKPEGKATEELRNSLRIGTLLGVQGTPATLIGNQLVPGALPYEQLEQLVKTELAKLG